MKARLIFHGAAVVLLVATVAAAQAPKEPAKKATASQSSTRESSAPSISEYANSSVQTAREAFERYGNRTPPARTDCGLRGQVTGLRARH